MKESVKAAAKKVLGNRYGRLLVGVLLIVVVATVGVLWAKASREQKRRRAAAARAAEVAPEPGRPSTSAEIAPGEARARLDGGEALLLDVREAAQFDASGGIAGAVNIPLAELARRRDELPQDKLIIAYAYTPTPAALEGARVAAALLEEDHRTAVLTGKFADWYKAGLTAAGTKPVKEGSETKREGKKDEK